jgi:hypothetical protein
MVWQIPGREILRAGDRGGKRLGEKIGGAHAQNLGRDRLPVLEARQHERTGGVPTPARFEHRLIEHRLGQHFFHRSGVQVIENVLQWKAVLHPEGNDNRFLVGGGLQLESESAAEAFPQGQAPGAVDPSAEGRVQHHLHSAAFVEEAFENDALLRWHRAQSLFAVVDLIGNLTRGFG